MEYTVRPYKKGEEQYVAEAHRRIYREEYNWGPAFSEYAAAIALDFAKKEHGPGEELWVAEDTAAGRLLGCIMLCGAGDDIGQLRLFLVEPDCRRFGIGSALTRALFDRARQAGYRWLILWTAGPLEDAVRIYGRLGFVQTETSSNTDWSLAGEPVTEIKMELEL